MGLAAAGARLPSAHTRYCELVAISVEPITMIVCNCNAIREREVRAVARQGHCDPVSAYRALGRRPRCGQCIPFARDIIAAERAIA
jgi:bacterioferritin-associated ferredoxin